MDTVTYLGPLLADLTCSVRICISVAWKWLCI